MGDALADILDDLRLAVRSRLGPPAADLPHTTDVIVDRICYHWPMRWMSVLARQQPDEQTCGEALDALAVIRSKVRETLEAKWGNTAANAAAFDLILQPAIVEMANIWFSGPAERMLFRKCCFQVRSED